MSLEDDIRYLRDIEAIRTAKARYAKCVDACAQHRPEAAAELIELFTEDAHCDFGELFKLVLTGHDQIKEHFGTVVPKSRAWMWHSVSNPIIEIEGDTAKASWTFYAMSTSREQPEEEPRLSYGRYQDEHIRTAIGWKQCKLKLINETRTWAAGQKP